MAECSIARCSQERRLFRRELQKWSKGILHAIGLERLAEELMGAQTWKLFVEPFTVLENTLPDDWYPEEICYICNAKKLPPYDPASGIIPTDGYGVLRIDIDEQSTSSDHGVAPEFSPTYTSALSPWHVTNLISPSLPQSSFDQPLDLSLRTPNEELNYETCITHNGDGLLKVPQIPLKSGLRKKTDGNSKRSYTEEELQAALRDIQSGKLGTRRAAVIYGIPRSTLRNKVYKLANESKFHSVLHSSKSKMSNKCLKQICDLKTTVDQDDSKFMTSNETLQQLLKNTIAQKAIGNNTQELLNVQSNEHLDETNESGQAFKTLECSSAIEPILSCVFANIHDLALGRCKENLNAWSPSKDHLKLPIFSELIHRLLEERIEKEKKCLKNVPSIKKSDMLPSKALPHVILKVPSFKATSECGIVVETDQALLSSSNSLAASCQNSSVCKGITVSFKELIAKAIAQKALDSSEEQNVELYQNNHEESKSWNIQNTLKQHMKEICALDSSDSKIEKRTRPKRGRYRNYDRDNLARAVKAVQKGEMSVHRAGTFFGVPHSTLEYKVKERHLLRPRKRDNFGSLSFVDTVDQGLVTPYDMLPLYRTDTKIAKQSSVNDLSTESEENHRPVMDSYPSRLSLWQSLPFFSVDLPQLNAGNFFASQMMRKLHENARLHENEERQKKQETQEFGLLETLIKSTLDKPTTSETKIDFSFVPELPSSTKRDNNIL